MTRHDGARIAEQVYARLKGELLDATIDMHERIDVAELAVRYEISPTPVREAAMRLLGERLLERHPRGGLRPISLQETQLKGIFEAHGHITGMAVSTGLSDHGDLAPLAAVTADGDADPGALFSQIVARTRNEELLSIAGNLADRLGRVWRVEGEILADAPMEYRTLGELWIKRDPALRRALRRYYARRIKAAAQLVWRVNA